jgi:hypothetical protein
MDRRLQGKKSQCKRRLYGQTKPGTLLKHHIPVKTDSWNVTPDPLITQRNSSLDGNAAFRKPANTGCGAPEGRSDLAEIFHLLGAQLLCDRSYAQTD